MDPILAARVKEDKDLRGRLVKLAKDYLKVGRDALAYWSADFDVCYDLLSCYSPMTKKDIEALERGHPKRYVLPVTATHITTMTTYVSQVLFGQETPWKVEGRRPEDDAPAEFLNQILRWNAEQMPTYTLGYLWCQDAIGLNRGVFYNSWAPIFKPELTQVQVNNPYDLDEDGNPRPIWRTQRRNKCVGGYNKMELVSPYDFVCDPTLPIIRLNEMRFCGHRVVIPVTELRRRSKLPVDHPAYVLPSAVDELVKKAKKGVAQADSAVPSLPGTLPNPTEIRLSRTAYERTKALQPTGQIQADKNDTGNVECWELWVRMVPSENKIYNDEDPVVNAGAPGVGGDASPAATPTNPESSTPLGESAPLNDGGTLSAAATSNPTVEEGEDPVIFQILICGGDVLLSINESTYAHGLYPYSVAEGRPNAHFQFSPGWIQILKGAQDYIDWLKNRHQEALSRTIGNVFVYDPLCVDVSDFQNPDKEGLLVALKPESQGKSIKDVFQQVPLKDMTENFLEEAMQFVKFSESVTGAGAAMQGTIPGGEEPSATQFAGTQQMGAGRLTAVARLLSSQALVPQTQQFVSNFQQFLEEQQAVRFRPTDPLNIPPELRDAATVMVSRDVIQGEFEFIAHDGTLPGTNGQKVAAIARLLECAVAFPQVFTPGPGNIDPRRLILQGAKASGLNVENFTYTASDIASLAAAQGGPPGAPPVPGGPQASPAPVGPPGAPPAGMPGLPTPPVAVTPPQAPGPKPLVPGLAPIGPIGLPPIAAKQPRPTNR